MNLVFIHGAPATGKFTVAKELLSIVTGRLFDNHVSIDFARSIFDFGAAGFDDLVYKARLLALTSAAEHRVALLVMTYCYAHPEDLHQFEAFETIWCGHGGKILPVYLHCAEHDTHARVVSPERKARQKISTPESLRRFNSAHDFQPLPRANVLALNTSRLSAKESAFTIARHFKLYAEHDA